LPNTIYQDKEITLMNELSDNPELGQRELAMKAGFSLGMVNTLLKRLVKKGWVTFQKANSRNISYLLTPEGTREFARRSYYLVKNTIGIVMKFSKSIDQFFEGLQQLGYKQLHILGHSQLDYLFKQSAENYKLELSFGLIAPENLELVYVISQEELDNRGWAVLDAISTSKGESIV